MKSCQTDKPEAKNNLAEKCHFFGKCGGCDFLDLSDEDYHKLKQDTLKQELEKLLESDLELENKIQYHFVGPKSRRRIALQIDSQNRLGFFAKKSNSLVEIDVCYVAEEKLSAFILPLKKFIKSQESNLLTRAVLTLFDNGLDLVFQAKRELDYLQVQRFIKFAKEYDLNISYQIKGELTPIYLARTNKIFYEDFKISVGSEVFIQATIGGLKKIIEIIRNVLEENKQVKNVADIYAGFGAYSFAISDLVSVRAFEGNDKMVASISKNAAANDLAHRVKAEEKDLFQDAITKKELNEFDLIIINPPRNGATPQITEIAKSKVNKVIYVSCNPKTFAFDARILRDAGFKVETLTALDQFHASKHLELVAVFGR
jgi:23S rRNA (uracil1939-C5)-methyltransferase